tara:strand:+ start:913 stop:1053 length:141 start_codon:yes stop_codon:yes gene_type:complete
MKQDLIKIIAELYSVLDSIEDANEDAKQHLHEAIDTLERLVLDSDD